MTISHLKNAGDPWSGRLGLGWIFGVVLISSLEAKAQTADADDVNLHFTSENGGWTITCDWSDRAGAPQKLKERYQGSQRITLSKLKSGQCIVWAGHRTHISINMDDHDENLVIEPGTRAVLALTREQAGS